MDGERISRTVELDAGTDARLSRLAEETGTSPETLIRSAVADLVERQDAEAFDRATVESWREYKRTGLHLTHEEVDAWLAKLEAGEDAELPPCHT